MSKTLQNGIKAALLSVCLSQCELRLKRYWSEGRDKMRETETMCACTRASAKEGDCSGFGSGRSVGMVALDITFGVT